MGYNEQQMDDFLYGREQEMINQQSMHIVMDTIMLPDRTLGSMLNEEGVMIAKTLELPWLDNKRGKSCIPAGIYHVKKQPPKADRPYTYFRLPDSETNRSGILIHIANNVDDISGCIGVGSRFGNYNTDHPTLEESTKKMKYLAETLPDEFTLEIKRRKA